MAFIDLALQVFIVLAFFFILYAGFAKKSLNEAWEDLIGLFSDIPEKTLRLGEIRKK
jgi:hypothetical protein